jgi:hypothetical protein
MTADQAREKARSKTTFAIIATAHAAVDHDNAAAAHNAAGNEATCIRHRRVAEVLRVLVRAMKTLEQQGGE